MVTKPDSIVFTVELYDDGAHGDSLASDGIFGADIPLTGPVGQYRVDVRVTILSDSSSLVDATAFELTKFQDLAVDSTLSFSRNSVVIGDTVTVSVTIRNFGTDPVSGVHVEFWDSTTNFATTTVNLTGNGCAVTSATWAVAAPDTHVLRVTVSPFAVPSEASYINNTVTKTLVLGQPIVGVGDYRTALKFWLGPAVPNPTTGSIAVRFTLPEQSKASFEIFDVAGRRIHDWQWEDLPAGAHTVVWDGRARLGQHAPAGIYFYRLQAGARFATKKVVRLQ